MKCIFPVWERRESPGTQMTTESLQPLHAPDDLSAASHYIYTISHILSSFLGSGASPLITAWEDTLTGWGACGKGQGTPTPALE